MQDTKDLSTSRPLELTRCCPLRGSGHETFPRLFRLLRLGLRFRYQSVPAVNFVWF